MLKQLLNIDLTISDVMLGIIIILGIIIFFKFTQYILRISLSRKSENEHVFKKLINKSDDLKPLN